MADSDQQECKPASDVTEITSAVGVEQNADESDPMPKLEWAKPRRRVPMSKLSTMWVGLEVSMSKEEAAMHSQKFFKAQLQQMIEVSYVALPPSASKPCTVLSNADAAAAEPAAASPTQLASTTAAPDLCVFDIPESRVQPTGDADLAELDAAIERAVADQAEEPAFTLCKM